jgi:RNA polymerase sigma-70 factor (ECF subfamily)
MHTTPVSLLERLRQPDEVPAAAAWTRFVQLYTPLLFTWARRLGLQESDATDLVQDVFTHLLQKLPEFQYDAGKSFRGWLHTVVRNLWRNKNRRLTEAPLAGHEAALAGLAAPDHAEVLTEAEYQRFLVGRALTLMRSDFEPSTWQAFWQCTVEGRSAAEAAAELRISVVAVRAAKFRVLCRLRQELAGLVE